MTPETISTTISTMQAIIGYTALVFVIIASLFGGALVKENVFKEEGFSTASDWVFYLVSVVGVFILIYLGLGVICGFFYVLAFIGVILREILMWFLVALFYPFAH